MLGLMSVFPFAAGWPTTMVLLRTLCADGRSSDLWRWLAAGILGPVVAAALDIWLSDRRAVSVSFWVWMAPAFIGISLLMWLKIRLRNRAR